MHIHQSLLTFIFLYSIIYWIFLPESLKCFSSCGIPQTCSPFFIYLSYCLNHSPESDRHPKLFPLSCPAQMVINFQWSHQFCLGKLIHACSVFYYCSALHSLSLRLLQSALCWSPTSGTPVSILSLLSQSFSLCLTHIQTHTRAYTHEHTHSPQISSSNAAARIIFLKFRYGHFTRRLESLQWFLPAFSKFRQVSLESSLPLACLSSFFVLLPALTSLHTFPEQAVPFLSLEYPNTLPLT